MMIMTCRVTHQMIVTLIMVLCSQVDWDSSADGADYDDDGCQDSDLEDLDDDNDGVADADDSCP